MNENIKLYQGDCLEVMDKLIAEGVKVDTIITDPPYGTTACKWDSVIPLEPMWEQLKRVIKPNGAIVIFGSEPFSSALRMSNIKQYKCEWYWKKERGTNFVQAKRYPMRVVENVLVFCKNTPNYYPIMRSVKPYTHVLPLRKPNSTQHMNSNSTDSNGKRIVKTYSEAYPTNVLEFSRDNMSKGKSYHPTQKPVALMEYLIRTYTNEGETVLDFTMGSGTTGVACVNINRKFIGIELDEGYYKIASERIHKVLSEKENI